MKSRVSNPILSVNSLEIGYFHGRNRKVILPPLNAVAGKGELIAVIGKNGIGKSTLLRTIAGVQNVFGGEIFYKGRNIHEYSRMDLAREVGYISTEIVKVPNMRVFDLVALGRFPHTNWIGKLEKRDTEIIFDAIEKTSMTDFRYKYVSELSDGERQKVMIARLLAQDTDIMVMDEPTAFLDVGSKFEIMHLLHGLSGKSQKTIIFSTHDLQMAVNQSDKIWLVLENCIREGAPEDLILDGSFENLFDSNHVKFDSQTGAFTFRGEVRGSLFIEGEGVFRHWTEEAIKRAGFGVSETVTKPYIRIDCAKYEKWELISQSGSEKFNSIYELILHLSNVRNLSI